MKFKIMLVQMKKDLFFVYNFLGIVVMNGIALLMVTMLHIAPLISSYYILLYVTNQGDLNLSGRSYKPNHPRILTTPTTTGGSRGVIRNQKKQSTMQLTQLWRKVI